MTLISIRERAEGAEGPNAVLSFDHGAEYPITINDPYSESEEERLEWYFEEHIRFPLTKQVIAQQAAASITSYDESLFDQVFADRQAYRRYGAALDAGIEIVRPGTYPALVDHLERVQDWHGTGYYHVIHFDVHGGLLGYAELEKGFETDHFLFQTRYGRDDIEEYEGLKAFLFLEGERERQADPVEAGELADLLVHHQIPITVLNACQSGKQVGASETSLGSRLMAAGVQMALAMGYSVTVSAAELIMRRPTCPTCAGNAPTS